MSAAFPLKVHPFPFECLLSVIDHKDDSFDLRRERHAT